MKIEIVGIDRSNMLEAGSLTVTRLSKERRTCYLNLFSAASSWLPAAGQDLKVYDDSSNIIFGGCIRKVDIQKYNSGNSNNTPVLSSIFSDGYNQIAGRKAVVSDFAPSYAGAIVEYFSSVALNVPGQSEGVGLGTIDDGAYFENYVKEESLFSEVLDELAAASGFKWYIDDAKDLYFTQESTTPDAAHSLMSTGTFYDYFDVIVSKSLDNYRNTQYVIGDREIPSGITIQTFIQSTAQIAIQQAIEGGSCYSSGIYANIIRDIDITSSEQAVIVANNALKQFGYPEGIKFSSYQTDWQPSTKLRAKLPKYGIDTDTYYLIEEVTLEKINANELVSHIVATRRNPDNFSSQKTDDDVDFMAGLVAIDNKLFNLNAKLTASGVTQEIDTFTPALEGGTNAGTWTWTEQTGHYVLHGNMVFVTIRLIPDSITDSPTGDLVLTGLPFTSADYYAQSLLVCTSGVSWGTGKTAVALTLNQQTKSGIFYGLENNGAKTAIPVGNVSAYDAIEVSGWYEILPEEDEPE